MFKTTERKKIDAVDVADSALEFQGKVQEGLDSFFAGELLDGETMPDLRFLQELISRKLSKNGRNLMVADDNHTRDLVSASDLRRQRDAIVAELQMQVRDGRLLLDRALGDQTVKAALRQRRVSRTTPVQLAQGARQMAESLRDPKYAGRGGAGLVDATGSVATQLVELAGRLEQVLDLLSPQKRSSQGSREEKVRDIEAAKRNTQRCAELLFGLYRVAGLDYHAERVRTTNRRRRAEASSGAAAGGGAAEVTGSPLLVTGLVN